MAEVPVTISNAIVIDYYGRTIAGPVQIRGFASRSDLSVGGGPMPPGEGEKPPTDPGHPAFPIWGPPGSNFPDKPGYPPVAGHPLPEPPEIVPVPPDRPNTPPPGSPPVIVGGTHPVNPMVPPQAVLIEYPGIGKVVVPQPTATAEPPAPEQPAR